MDTSKVHFATLPPKELGDAIISRVRDYYRHPLVRLVHDLQWKSWCQYYGYGVLGNHTSNVEAGGRKGDLALVSVNHQRALVNALSSLITGPKYSWTAQAASYDHQAKQQTKRAKQLLEHCSNNTDMATTSPTRVLSAVALSEGFTLLGWDPFAGDDFLPGGERRGDFTFKNVQAWDVVRDPNKHSYALGEWVAVRMPENKYDLAARFPQFAKQILDAPIAIDHENELELPWRRASNFEFKSDDVETVRFYHRATPAVPEGREAIVLADGTVIADDVLQYGMIPLSRVEAYPRFRTPFAYTQTFDILGMQTLQDSMYITVASNFAQGGRQKYWVPRGDNLTAADFGDFALMQSDQKPEALNLTANPQGWLEFIQNIKMNMELVMGLNEVVRGQSPGDRSSGSFAALLQSQAIQQAAHLQTQHVEALKYDGRLILNIFRREASRGYRISVAERRYGIAREFMLGKEEIGEANRVYIEMGSAIQQSTAGRMEFANLLVQMKVVTDPKMALEVFTTGNLDPITRAIDEEMNLILEENDSITNGVAPKANDTQDHWLHGREHRMCFMSMAAQDDAGTAKALQEHLFDHYSLAYGIPLEKVGQIYVVDPVTGATIPGPDPLFRENMRALLFFPAPPPMALTSTDQAAQPPPANGAPDAAGKMPPVADVAAPPGSPAAVAENQPSMPTNPSTGMKWNPTDGGRPNVPPTQ